MAEHNFKFLPPCGILYVLFTVFNMNRPIPGPSDGDSGVRWTISRGRQDKRCWPRWPIDTSVTSQRALLAPSRHSSRPLNGLKHDANPNPRDDADLTPLHRVAVHGNKVRIRRRFEKCPEIQREKDDEGHASDDDARSVQPWQHKLPEQLVGFGGFTSVSCVLGTPRTLLMLGWSGTRGAFGRPRTPGRVLEAGYDRLYKILAEGFREARSSNFRTILTAQDGVIRFIASRVVVTTKSKRSLREPAIGRSQKLCFRWFLAHLSCRRYADQTALRLYFLTIPEEV
ncbi:hypothetical protein BJY52DRAFT_1416174, partial [Lactarius psammicola]